MSDTLTPESRGRLINLKTNLKSLKFGGDRPASGTSNQPYEITPIPGGTEYGRDGMPLQSGPDFVLRNGFLAPLRALKDVSRLAKMFIDTKSPRGLFFTLKENLLSRTNVKTQASFGAGYIGGIMNQGAYLPLGTLLQAGFNWAGAHLNKNGLNPIGSLGGPAGVNRNARGGAGALNPYSVVVRNDQLNDENRLISLQHFVARGLSSDDSSLPFGSIGANFKINPGATEEDPFTPILYSYGGGPGSILGVGKTKLYKDQPFYNAIRNYEGLARTNTSYNGIGPKGISPLLVGNNFLNYTNPANGYKSFKVGGDYPRSFSNFVIENSLENTFQVSRIIHKAPDYLKQNKGLRTNLGDPGRHATYAVESGSAVLRNVYNYGISANQMQALDKITALKIYESSYPNTKLPINDLCKFRIAVIKNGPDEGRNSQYVHFRAYISGFTDNYGATWNDTQYVGRGNVFKNYGGFTRDIQMGFVVAATSKAELIPMYTKLNFLASSLAPDYTESGFMRGNIVRMTVGGYLYEVPGVLTTLTYTIPDDSTWEISIDNKGDSDLSVKELPHRIEVQLGFTPIEDFLPSRQTLTYDENGVLTAMGPQRFISIANGLGTKYNNYDNEESGIGQYTQPEKSNTNKLAPDIA